MSDIFDTIFDDMGLSPPEDETPEQAFYRNLTSDKYPKLNNCQYWLKHELYIYCVTLQKKNWLMTKPSGTTRVQVSTKELARGLLTHYFLMMYLPKFENERGREQGKQLNMDQFLDLVMEYPPIKKTIENPTSFI